MNSLNNITFGVNEKRFLGKAKEVFRPKTNLNTLSEEDHMILHQRGLFAGMEAKELGVEACRDIIIKETLAGNMDYLKGFNQAIGKDLAKKVYASINNLVK